MLATISQLAVIRQPLPHSALMHAGAVGTRGARAHRTVEVLADRRLQLGDTPYGLAHAALHGHARALRGRAGTARPPAEAKRAGELTLQRLALRRNALAETAIRAGLGLRLLLL
jgi:hypothetical protein